MLKGPHQFAPVRKFILYAKPTERIKKSSLLRDDLQGNVKYHSHRNDMDLFSK